MKRYLAAYNLFALMAWIFAMSIILRNHFMLDSRALTMLTIAQFTALLEIFHAAKGWAGGNWVLTALQVSSRVLVVSLLHFLPQQFVLKGIGYYGVAVISIAWGITEVVRYSYYRMQLRNGVPQWLEWLRYSLFLGLYPAGVTGELLVMWAFVQWLGIGLNLPTVAFGAVVVAYAVFFPKLFGHMLAQRKKKLG